MATPRTGSEIVVERSFDRSSSFKARSKSRKSDLADLPASTIRKQLQQIIQSTGFAHSERLGKFLQYAVEKAIQGERLKEYGVGVDVYGRDVSYDPRLDPIVRVEARRLRLKLNEYYQEEGREAPVIIDLPKGSYLPVFRKRISSKAALRLHHQHGEAWVTEPAATLSVANPVVHNSIAVLPFVNTSGEPETEHFSDGLSDELINALNHLDGLRVVGRTSAWVFKDKAQDIRQVGKLLNVETVLGGSVRKSGNRLRITAQLSNTADGYQFWSEVYEEELRDFFEIQDAITKAITEKLKLQVQDERKKGLVRPITNSMTAYAFYVKGRTCLFKWNRQGWEKAARYFEWALLEDPNCAAAYAGLAESLFLPGVYGELPPTKVVPKAREAAQRGLQIDDSIAEAHLLLGLITAHYEWRWQEAWVECERALQLKPGYALGHYWYSSSLAIVGQLEQALQEANQALALDPLSVLPRMALARVFYLRGELYRAIEEYQKAIELNPNFPPAHSFLGLTYAAKSLFSQAIKESAESVRLSPNSPLAIAILGYCYALSGKMRQARQMLDRLSEIADQIYVSAGFIALIYLGLGEKDRALDWLEKGCEERQFPLGPLRMGPFYENLRSSPRFTALLKKMNLQT